jgi:hypothetical protein
MKTSLRHARSTLHRAKCPRCGFVVCAVTWDMCLEAQRTHTRSAHPDAPELHVSLSNMTEGVKTHGT